MCSKTRMTCGCNISTRNELTKIVDYISYNKKIYIRFPAPDFCSNSTVLVQSNIYFTK